MITDNFFTSLHLAKELKQKGSSLVGTCSWMRRELPMQIHSLQPEMKRFESKLYEEETRAVTLTLYKCKPNKAVLIMSSLHSTCRVDESHKKRLPETISYYNKTKHGVDVCDQMIRQNTITPQSRRWPVHFSIIFLISEGLIHGINLLRQRNRR